MIENSPMLAGLSPVEDKDLLVSFDSGELSSDAGILALREIEARLGVANRLAGCLNDPRSSDRVIHPRSLDAHLVLRGQSLFGEHVLV